MLRYGAYHRVSQANGRDIEDDTTITDKEAWDQIDGWGRMRGIDTSERYLDWDTSGSNMSRPELDRMLADLDAGRIDGIVVAQVDRLSRANVGDALGVVKQIAGEDESNPRPLVLLDLGIDPSTEFGEFGLTILLALARMQWRRYKRQYASAQKRAVARGVWIGPAPLGYDRGDDGVLVPNDRGPSMNMAFRVAARDGLHAACAHLAVTFPERRWETSDARRVLSMRAYLGEVAYGVLINREAHPPLTTLAVFEAAQTEPRSRRSNGDYVLSGVATCLTCGGPMVGALQTVKERSYRRMRCNGCGANSIAADNLERYVRSVVQAEIDRMGGLAFAGRQVRGDADAAREALEQAESDALEYALNVALQRTLGVKAYQAGAELRGQAVDQARARYQALASRSERAAQVPSAGSLGDPGQLLRAIHAGVDAIIVRPGRGRVEDRVEVRFLHNVEDNPFAA